MSEPKSLRAVLLTLFAPFLSTALLTLGNGYFTTVSTLQLKHLGSSILVIGSMATVYFVGIMLGSYQSQHWINRVGHIRSYAAFAALMTVSALMQGLVFNEVSWLICRFIYGYGLAGLYLVLEAWMLTVSGTQYKGRVFAVYLTLFYISTGLGQLGLLLPLHGILMVFSVIAVLTAASIIPVCTTHYNAPDIDQPEIMSPIEVVKKVPLGAVTCVVAGGVLGVIYAMLPLFFAQIGTPKDHIAWLMLMTIFGAAIFQFPVGKYSDKVDRRYVLGAMCFATALISLAIVLFHTNIYILYTLTFIFGGFAFTINPLGIAHASDYLSPKATISAISTLVLMYGVGSAVGPLVVSGFIHSFGTYGFFVYMIIVTAPLGVFALTRVYFRKAASEGQFVPNAAVGIVPPEQVLGESLPTEDD